MKNRERRRVKKRVAPIYTAAIAWFLYCQFFPLYSLWHFFALVGVTAAIYIAAKQIFPNRIVEEAEPEKPVEPEKPAEPEKQADPEVAAVVAEGKLAMSEMNRLKNSIANPDVKTKISQIMILSDKIVKNAETDKMDIPRIKKFLSYYLPTTIKLLNAYDRMDAQGINGENIGGTMRRIEDILDTIIVAYEKQLDALFADEALDIETDIDVLDGMLKREGLKNGDFGKTQQGV